MADTARKNQEQKVQNFDSPQVLAQKVEIAAKLILKSKHFIAFTGAGISTSCGIPDFRSGMNTVLKTGPGVWQKRANNVQQTQPNPNIVDRNRAIPSFTHMSLIALQKAKILKFLVSQNTDGLHLRSGFNPFNLAELHGNRMLQKCKKCQGKFLRDFITRQAKKVHDHETSRLCQNCGSTLYDSIINFGENLPQYELNKSLSQADQADLCLALGSSLTVNPAANIPKTVAFNGKLIIVNLQPTPLDKIAFLKVNAMCDDFMKPLMEKLKIEVQQFLLHRYLQFWRNKNNDILNFRGIDQRRIPFTYLKNVSLANQPEKSQNIYSKGGIYQVRSPKQGNLLLVLQFNRWLKQPDVKLTIQPERRGIVQLIYDPFAQKWQQPIWSNDFQKK